MATEVRALCEAWVRTSAAQPLSKSATAGRASRVVPSKLAFIASVFTMVDTSQFDFWDDDWLFGYNINFFDES